MRWTEQEKKTLRHLYSVQKMPFKEIAVALDKTIPQINSRLAEEVKSGALKRRYMREWKYKTTVNTNIEFTEYVENGVTIKRYPAMYAWGVKSQHS